MDDEKYTIIPLDSFKNKMTKLSDVHEAMVWNKLSAFRKNPFHPSFSTHKMRGKKRNFESYINMDIRIIWKFGDDNTVLLIDVGHHDVLKKY
jgi:mRNA-degrading endonuclease RelE of RelBE toxin-antitoxin system